MRKEWLAVVSMLVTMKTNNGLRRGAIMFITKIFGVACCTVYLTFTGDMHELGIINSPEVISCKKCWKKATEFVHFS